MSAFSSTRKFPTGRPCRSTSRANTHPATGTAGGSTRRPRHPACKSNCATTATATTIRSAPIWATATNWEKRVRSTPHTTSAAITPARNSWRSISSPTRRASSTRSTPTITRPTPTRTACKPACNTGAATSGSWPDWAECSTTSPAASASPRRSASRGCSSSSTRRSTSRSANRGSVFRSTWPPSRR